MRKELLHGLTEEQIEKVKACKNQEEVLKIAKEEGVELNDDQLEAVSGGCGTVTAYNTSCPSCNSKNMVRRDIGIGTEYECKSCGHKYTHYSSI